jgi:hypothetical protein
MSLVSQKFDYRAAIQDICDALNALFKLKTSVQTDLSDDCQTPLTSPSSTTTGLASEFFNCVVLLSPYLCLSLSGSNSPYQNVIADSDQVTDYGVCVSNQCNLSNLYVFRKSVTVDANLSLSLLLSDTDTSIYDSNNSPTVIESLETLISHYQFIKTQWVAQYRSKFRIPLLFLRELIDVFEGQPESNQALVYQNGNWINQFLTLAEGLGDVTITDPGSNIGTSGTGRDVLAYNFTTCRWENDCLELNELCDVLVTNPGTNTGTSGNGVDSLVYDTANSRWVNNCLGLEDLCDVRYANGGPANNDILFWDAANGYWTTQENPDNVFGIRSDAQKRVFRFDAFGPSGTPGAPDGTPDSISTTSNAWIPIGTGLSFWPTPDNTSVFAMEAQETSDYLLIFTGAFRRNNQNALVQIRLTADESGVATPSLDLFELLTDTTMSIGPSNSNTVGEGSSISTIYTVKDVQQGTIFNVEWRRGGSGTISMDSGIFLIFSIAQTTS